MAKIKKALEGIKILDLSQYEAGPACTLILGFLGAEVIKIEIPGMGEPGRTTSLDIEGEKNGWDSWFYILLNANKKAITLNLKSAQGLAMFKEMVKKADVVVSNFVPGQMDKLGIGYSTLSKINPGIIYAENSGFGAGGPYSSYAAFDAVAKAAGGVYSTTGYPGGPPANPGANIGDSGAGLHMAIAILAALRYRYETGEGQAIDISMADNIINMERTQLRHTIETGKPLPRCGGGGAGSVPWDVYKCQGDDPNAYLFIATPRDTHYAALLKAIGREDLVTMTWRDRRLPENALLIRKAIEDWTGLRDKWEAFHILAKAQIPCAPVMNTVEVLNDPHFIQRGIVTESIHPRRGKHKMIGCPVIMSKSPVEIIPAPALGEHNEQIYKEWLGLTANDLQKLKEAKVI